ncbi:MAG: hypothetical protein AAFX87_11795 [Bacteroidota bacterium]
MSSASTNTYFLDAIYHLRTNEEVKLFDKMLHVSTQESSLVGDFLMSEYDNERLDYPHDAPEFDIEAAIWGAKLLYQTCQLILNRENKVEDLRGFFPAFDHKINDSSVLSADLCLRFLPQVLIKAKLIDPEDELIAILEEHLTVWHYSGIGYDLSFVDLDWAIIMNSPCLKQLYANRVIENKSLPLANMDVLNDTVKGSLGDYASLFWKEL